MKPRPVAALALGWYLMALGGGCLAIVVLTHVCERFRLLPWMGWGLKHSAGHYLDLCARTTISARRIVASFSSAFPLQDWFARVLANLQAAPAPSP